MKQRNKLARGGRGLVFLSLIGLSFHGSAKGQSSSISALQMDRINEAFYLLNHYGESAWNNFKTWLDCNSLPFFLLTDNKALLLVPENSVALSWVERLLSHPPIPLEPITIPESRTGYRLYAANRDLFISRFSIQPEKALAQVIPEQIGGRRLFVIQSLEQMWASGRMEQFDHILARNSTEYWLFIFAHETHHLFMKDHMNPLVDFSSPETYASLLDHEQIWSKRGKRGISTNEDNLLDNASNERDELLEALDARTEAQRDQHAEAFIRARKNRYHLFLSMTGSEEQAYAAQRAFGQYEWNEGSADYFAARLLFLASAESPKEMKERMSNAELDVHFSHYEQIRSFYSRKKPEHGFYNLLQELASLDRWGRDSITNPLFRSLIQPRLSFPRKMNSAFIPYSIGVLEVALLEKYSPGVTMRSAPAIFFFPEHAIELVEARLELEAANNLP